MHWQSLGDDLNCPTELVPKEQKIAVIAAVIVMATAVCQKSETWNHFPKDITLRGKSLFTSAQIQEPPFFFCSGPNPSRFEKAEIVLTLIKL